MEQVERLFEYLVELDQHLLDLVGEYGAIAYTIFFLVIFFESTITPILPGDSLIFAAGALATDAVANVHALLLLFASATISGVTVSYFVGKWAGPRLFREGRRFFRPDRLERTRHFYDEYGARTMLLARFVPVVRTFAPIVAGMADMRFPLFTVTNVAGGFAWVGLFLYGGYFFGRIPAVRENFALVVLGVFLVSMIPVFTEWYRIRRRRK